MPNSAPNMAPPWDPQANVCTPGARSAGCSGGPGWWSTAGRCNCGRSHCGAVGVRDDERFKLPGSRPFARSPTLSMPRGVCTARGGQWHSTTFHNILARFADREPRVRGSPAISERGYDNTIYAQFRCARTRYGAPTAINWRLIALFLGQVPVTGGGAAVARCWGARSVTVTSLIVTEPVISGTSYRPMLRPRSAPRASRPKPVGSP